MEDQIEKMKAEKKRPQQPLSEEDQQSDHSPQDKKKKIQLGPRIPPEMVEQIDKLARAQGMSRMSWISLAIFEKIKRDQKEI